MERESHYAIEMHVVHCPASEYSGNSVEIIAYPMVGAMRPAATGSQ